ncbi:MBL fold metallo-hydrolase [Treponema sp.]|uniref:MBL fold metallo-hydrolase n=1 Tax=Treponema sp. TaxID=166 RepID=UPI001D480BAB|nr:MBL fold metallo-hydrolase [Treponema sp.]MBS7241991.1 MBL fold metallo-hydrolase [Treponema sp.]MCI6441971.1 MBL fold metallo-hydrolase [Spirochaetia bacterium]MDY4131633.1 MBL fold metallo-hydrolase [Treponema sp.]
MFIHFWGVRGSLPKPLNNENVQAKLTAAIARMTPKDLESAESKMKFISSLPDWIYGTYGGNTPCIELRPKSGEVILLDCGTGLRDYAMYGKQPEDRHYTIFLSHLHWDHIQGFPFFGPSFNPAVTIDIYSPFDDVEESLEKQSSTPFFPPNGCWESVKNQCHFHKVEEGVPLELYGMKIECLKMFHPGDSYSYSFQENHKKFIYCTDAELQPSDFDKSIERNFYFQDADVLVLDSQYTNPEAARKVNWGHSSFSRAVEFASIWNVSDLYFFHHEPAYDDKKLDSILSAGINYQKYNAKGSEVKIHMSREGQEIVL